MRRRRVLDLRRLLYSVVRVSGSSVPLVGTAILRFSVHVTEQALCRVEHRRETELSRWRTALLLRGMARVLNFVHDLKSAVPERGWTADASGGGG